MGADLVGGSIEGHIVFQKVEIIGYPSEYQKLVSVRFQDGECPFLKPFKAPFLEAFEGIERYLENQVLGGPS